MDETIQIERNLLVWINAQPNSAYIKAWILNEENRRIEWMDETGLSARALAIQTDVMDALFYMAGLAKPVYEDYPMSPGFKLYPPSHSGRYACAFVSLIVGLKREAKTHHG